MTENEIGTLVLDAAFQVHRALGPGLLETVYEGVLEHELKHRSLHVQRQVPVRVEYRVIIELKSVEAVTGAHKKQVQTYLRLTNCKLGYLLNFGCELMRDGITRCVNGLQE